MEVTVFFYGGLRDSLGKAKVVVSLPDGSSLRELIDKLGEELGDRAKSNLYPNPDSGFPLMIAVGGKEHRFCGGMNAKLGDKTSVYFMPPAMGG